MCQLQGYSIYNVAPIKCFQKGFVIMKSINNIKTNLQMFLMEIIVTGASHNINHIHVHVQRPFIYIKGGHKPFSSINFNVGTLLTCFQKKKIHCEVCQLSLHNSLFMCKAYNPSKMERVASLKNVR